MSSQLKNIFRFPVLFFFAFCVISGADRVLAADVTIAPSDLMSTKADADATPPVTAKSAQEKVMEKIKNVGAGDTVTFPSGSYKDVGEILITTSGEPSDDPDTAADEGDGPVVFQGTGTIFTGKIMFNVKASHVVIRGFTFMDTAVPDAVTIKYHATVAEQIKYGFPGVTVEAFLEEETDDAYDDGATPTVTNVDDADNLANNAERWVTVVGGDDAGSIANKADGTKVGGTTNDYDIWGEGITSAKAKDGIGTVWVDSVIHSGTCRMSTGTTPMDIQVTGVVIRNNAFSNTEIAAVRAGDHSPIQGTNQCMPQVDVIGNTFMNIGGNGPFAERSANTPVRDANMNRIADIGNREPAIDLRNVRAARVTDNTIGMVSDDGTSVPPGTSDAIVVMNAPARAAISIENNRITNPMLNGILIADTAVESVAAMAASITVSGNVISGVNTNRYLTAPYTSEGYNAAADPAEDDGSTDPVLQSYTSERDADCYRSATEAAAARNLRLAPEVWRSRVAGFPFTELGAPRSLVASTGAVDAAVAADIGNTDLIRYKADECFNLGSVKVVSQEGVSITNNDLGYVEGAEFSLDSLDYGVVVEGVATTTLAALRGNNIGLYSVSAVAVSSTVTKAVPVAGNYLGERPRPSDRITGDAEDDPIAAAADAPRGPREDVVNPDILPPDDSGAGLNADRTMLTITYNEDLDGDSEPAASAFTVRKRIETGRWSPIAVSRVAVDGRTVTLTLASSPTIEAGDTVTVAYDVPSDRTADKIQDAAGNPAPSIEAMTVTNPSAGPSTGPGTAPSTGSSDGGCALASAGSFGGVDLGMILPLLAVPFVFGLRRKARKN